LGFNGI